MPKKETKKKNSGGRPKKINDVQQLEIQIEEYFDWCDKRNKPYTLSGLANHIGIDRRTLLNYSKEDKFFPTIKRAKDRCMQYAEECLYRANGNVTGIIFAMKNNYGFTDSQIVDAKVEATTTINVHLEEDEV